MFMIGKNLITFLSNQSILFWPIFKKLNKFNKLKTLKEKTKKENINVYDAASELYNELLETQMNTMNNQMLKEKL